MIRLLAFLVIFYLIFKAGRFFLKVLLGENLSKRTATYGQQSYRQSSYQKQSDSVHIDYIPPKNKKQSPKGSYKGGEYVDFEEVD